MTINVGLLWFNLASIFVVESHERRSYTRVMALARISQFFPTLIYNAPLLANKKQLASIVKELRSDSIKVFERDNNGQKWSASNYTNGYTSYSSVANLHEVNSTFAELKSQIDKHVKNYCKALGFEKNYKLSMQSCWLNIMPPAATHSLHLHPLSVISGTFYVEVPAGSGAIKFEDPRLSKMMSAPPRNDKFSSAGFAKFSPKKGDLILFESWLRHEVEVNRGKAERMSLSFNYS
jgi:uncharacterized protein (TIGR02466 family)